MVSIVCGQCSEMFSSDSSRKHHIRDVHQASTSVRLADESKVVIHRTGVGERNGFACPNRWCDKIFTSPPLIQKHTPRCSEWVAPSLVDPAPVAPALSDDDDLGESHLSRFNIVFNFDLHVLICRKCRHALSPTARYIREHIRDRHDGAVPTLVEVQQAIASYPRPLSAYDDPSISAYVDPQASLLPPIDGVKIHNGYRCQVCPGYFGAQRSTLIKHIKTAHPGSEAIEGDSYERCLVQTLFVGLKLKYYGITHLDVNNDAVEIPVESVLGAIRRQREARRQSAAITLDDRCRQPLIRSTNWDKIINAEFDFIDPLQLMKITADADPAVEQEMIILDAANDYIDLIHRFIDKCQFATRRKLMSGNTDQVIDTRGFRAYQEISTRRRCAARLARIVLMMTRIRQLRDDAHDRLLVDDAELISAIDDVVDAAAIDGADSASLIPHIHRLIMSLFCRTYALQQSYIQCMVYRFVIFSSIIEDEGVGYSFRSSLKVSSALSEVQFWARGALLAELFREDWMASTTATTEEYVMDRHHYQSDSAFREFNRLCEYITDGRHTPFNAVRELLRLLSVIVGSQPEIPPFYWADSECRSLSSAQNRFSITIDHLSTMVEQVYHDAFEIVNTKLLYGFNLAGLDAVISSDSIYDNFYNDNVGYSFLSEPKNNFTSFSDQFTDYIVSHCRQFFVNGLTSSGDVIWNMDNVHTYLRACDEFLELFICLTHLTAGQPLRGEEAKSLMISRTGSSVNRSIYVINNKLCLLQRYHKGQSKSGKSKYIARFIAPQHTRLCLIYLALIRPLQSVFAEMAYSQEAALLYSHCLFVAGGEQITGAKYSGMLRSCFQNYLEMPIGIADYRQIATAFMSRWLQTPDCLDSPEEEVSSIFDLQAGHSSSTAAMRYGRTTHEAQFMDRNMLRAFEVASMQWQLLLRVPTKPSIDPVPTPATTSSVAEELQPPGQEGAASNVVEPADDDGAAEFVVYGDSARPVVLLSDQPASKRIRTVYLAPSPRTDFSYDPPALCHFSKAEAGLQMITHDSTPRWRSANQHFLVALVLEGVRDVLAVLPTAAGKSMAFLIPALVQDKVIVLIVPLVALKHDAKRRLDEAGIAASFWRPCTSPTAATKVVIVSIECIPNPAYKLFINGLQYQQRLLCVVIDEAHLCLQRFRPAMMAAWQARTAHVPMIALSATVPPQRVQELESLLGAKFTVLRDSTSRPEIRYEVVNVNGADSDEHFLHAARDIVMCVLGGHLSPDDKMIIYAMTVRFVRMFGDLLSAANVNHVVYHGDLQDHEKTLAMTRWRSSKVVVATSAFGAGVDSPDVRFVVHLVGAYDIMSFAQETGRAGRDGRRAVALTISNGRQRSKMLSIGDGGGCHEMRRMFDWVENNQRCRRQLMQQYLDVTSYPCMSCRDGAMCDLCSSAGEPQRQRQVQEPPPRIQLSVPALESHTSLHRRSEVITRVNGLLKELVGSCSVCFAAARVKLNHGVAGCPRLRDLCFKCMGTAHSANNCPAKIITATGVCYHCGMPQDGDLHPSTPCNRRHPAADKVQPAVWFALRNQSAFGALQQQFGAVGDKDSDMQNWLYKVEAHTRLTYLVLAFDKICGSHISIK